MEFKGTKKEWILTHPEGSNGFLYVGTTQKNGNIATCYTVNYKDDRVDDVTIETKANALLISKAHEMLQMLEKLSVFLKWQSKIDTTNGCENAYNDCIKLIEEATKID